jgi:hypothetical protein
MAIKKIAIIGAPFSGKSDLSLAIERYIVDHQEAAVVEITDEYAEDWRRATNIQIGEFATYIGNMQLAMDRFSREQEADALLNESRFDGCRRFTITCGTVLETIIYAAFNALVIYAASRKSNAPLDIFNNIRTNTTLLWLTHFKADTWHYDHVFYLPLSEEIYKMSESFEPSDEQPYNPYAVPIKIDTDIPEAAEVLQVKYEQLAGPQDRSWEPFIDKLLEVDDIKEE